MANAPSTALEKVYDSEKFRQSGHHLVDFLADQLKSMTCGATPQVIDWVDPQGVVDAVDDWIGNPHFFEGIFERCIHLHHPHYLGHQLMPPAPVAALAGLFGDFVNNGMGVYEMGIAGSAMDEWILQKVGQKLGIGVECGGVITSGGSLANLTALLAARADKIPGSWDGLGESTTPRLALIVSAQSHYCVDRAAKIMGWGAGGVIKVPTNDQYQIRCDRLQGALDQAKNVGRQVIAVVGSACTTSTGSYDDLSAIGAFARHNDLWFHVDGAHGAAAIFSQHARSLVRGIELADSVTLDFHKMLMTPAITSALVFRNKKKAYQSFSQDAQYLWEQDGADEWFNMAKRTFECTKTMMSLKVCSIVAKHGWEIFGQNVDRLNDLGRAFALLIEAADDFQLAVQPQTNIVCFRFYQSDTDLNELNSKIRKALLHDGKFYIVQTALDGDIWLRTTISNPLTTPEHLAKLLNEIREIAPV